MDRRTQVTSLPEEKPDAAEEWSPEDNHAAPQGVPGSVTALGLVVIYALGVGSVLFTPDDGGVALWWPAAGVGVALVVLARPRARWLVALGIVAASALAAVTVDRDTFAALGFGVSDALEAYVVAWLVTRSRTGIPSLRTMEDLGRFLSATAAGAALAALGIGLTSAYLLDDAFLQPTLAVVASHAAAIVVITPLVLRVGPSTLGGRTAEAVADWVLLIASVGYVFRPDQVLSLTFLPLPFLTWAALRFGLRTVSAQLVAAGVLATALTAAGGGPFSQGVSTGVTTVETTALLAQAYLLVMALIAISLAVAMDQRKNALTRLTQNEELFQKSFTESFVGMLLLGLSSEGLRVRELNQTAADILGGPIEDFEDRPLSALLDSNTKFDDVAATMLAGEVPGYREEMWLTTEPGRRVGLAMSPLSAKGEEAMFSAQLIDVTDVYVASTRLQTEKDFTAAVLSTTACPIVVVDVEGVLAGLNPAGEKVTGLAEADVLEKPLWGTLVPDSERRRLGEMLDRTRPGREAPTYEGDLISVAGGLRRIVWSSAPLTNESGRRTHVVLTGIDVTDERNVRSMAGHLLKAATSTTFVGVDLGGKITTFNAGAEELLGYRSTEVTGSLSLVELHDPHEVAAVAAELGTQPGLATIVAGVDAGPQTRDWTYVRQDGSRVACAVTMSAVRDAFGSHIGYLAVGHDVSESRRSERILLETVEKERDAVERLRDLDRAKDEFVSMVSNELQKPLSTMIGYAEMLRDGTRGPVTREQARLLDAVSSNGERLVALLEDLLTLTRMDAGTLVVDRSPVDLLTVFERAHAALEPMLVGRHLDVGYDLPDSPVVVLGDASQLERVVVNIVGNAIKFTDDGGRVHWSLSAGDGMADIQVNDTGIGIPEAEQPLLFSRFFRSSRSQERDAPGTGLGLAIVQWIVHGHGGDVSIRSRDRVGTDVRVELPLAAR